MSRATRRFSVTAGRKPCEHVQFRPNTVNTLACPLLSNLATRHWLHDKAPLNVSSSYRVLPTGDLLLVGSQERLGVFECWSQEEGFQQLVASYCPEVVEDEVAHRTDQGGSVPVIINTSRVSAPAAGRASWGGDKSYWNEFLVMCTLFGLAVVLLFLFFLYRHRDGMKDFLKQGECATVHPKTRPVVLPPETRPLNGVGPLAPHWTTEAIRLCQIALQDPGSSRSLRRGHSASRTALLKCPLCALGPGSAWALRSVTLWCDKATLASGP